MTVIGAQAQQVQPQQAPTTGETQKNTAARESQPSQGQRGRWTGPVDEDRARQLYVSNDPADHALGVDFERQIQQKAETDKRYAEVSKGVVDFKKVSYRSSVGDLDIPAYLFQPLTRRGARGHAALVWVHGSVHGDWGITMWPFVREAVERGYVVICPEYRGSTGYGEKYYNEIDYGGYEIDDVLSGDGVSEDAAVRRHRAARRHGLEPRRLHHALLRLSRQDAFQGGRGDRPGHEPHSPAVILKGPTYQRSFSTQKRIGGLPFEKREIYLERSPLYHVDKLRTPLLVHVATNDEDVEFVEDQQIVDALRSRKPDLAETKVYVDPPPGRASRGHTFSRRVNPETLAREDQPGAAGLLVTDMDILRGPPETVCCGRNGEP